MKYFFIFVSLLASIVFFVFFLLFTQSGNNTIKPYIQEAIQKKLKKDVIIEAFTLKTDFIDAEIIIDKNSKLILNGTINILNQTIDVDYTIDAKNLETPYVNIDGSLHVKGNIKGKMENFQVDGKGIALNSKIVFLSTIVDKKLKAIKLNAKNIKIENILAFLKKPIYSRGMIDVNMNIKPKKDNNYFGDSNITVHYGTINNSVIEKYFGLKLNNMITYTGTINSTAYGQTIKTKTNITSNVANIKTKNSQYDFSKETFYSDYMVYIPRLSELNDKIQGKLTIDGNIKKTKEDFSFDINSKSLGGDIKVIALNNTLKLDANDIKLKQISHLLKQPSYSDGILSLSLNMQDTTPQNRNGKLILGISNGTLHVKKLLETKAQDDINYVLSLRGDIVLENASIESEITSDVLKLNISKSDYNLTNNTINGQYSLNVADLNNLYFITKRPLKGSLDVIGNYGFDNELYIDGNSSFLDAQTTFKFEKNNLHIQSNDLSTLKITDTLYYPKVFDSFSTLGIDYNLTNKIGLVDINALNGKLIKSELTEIISLASGFDLTSEIYKDTIFRGVIDKDRVDFSLLMNGLESYFKIPDGYLNLETNKIDSKFNIKIRNKDLQGTIKGSLDKPNVELSGSSYIKRKLEKQIEKNVPQEWQDTAKELLKLFD